MYLRIRTITSFYKAIANMVSKFGMARAEDKGANMKGMILMNCFPLEGVLMVPLLSFLQIGKIVNG